MGRDSILQFYLWSPLVEHPFMSRMLSDLSSYLKIVIKVANSLPALCVCVGGGTTHHMHKHKKISIHMSILTPPPPSPSGNLIKFSSV